MNLVRITMNVLPEKQKELVQTLVSMMGAVGKESGCLSYALFGSIEDHYLLNLIEEWRTRKDLDHHLRSEMFGVLLGTKSLLCRPMKVEIYSVSNTEGMEAVHSARKNNGGDRGSGRFIAEINPKEKV